MKPYHSKVVLTAAMAAALLASAGPTWAAGVRIDGNGVDQGMGADPNGRYQGSGIDPNGRDEGPGLDPNGRGFGIDPNGRGAEIDPDRFGFWGWLLNLFGWA